MARDRSGFFDKLRAAFTTGDRTAFESALKTGDAGEGEGHHIEVHNHHPGGGTDDTEGRLSKLEEGMSKIGDAVVKMGDALATLANKTKDDDDDEEKKKKEKADADKKAADEAAGNTSLIPEFGMEAPPGTSDAQVKGANDSALLEDSFAQTVAAAEILVPGIQVATFDKAAAPKKTLDALFGMRRTALELAYSKPDTRAMIDNVTAGRAVDFKTMKANDMRPIFNSVVAMKKAANNGGGQQQQQQRTSDNKDVPRTIADLNKLHASLRAGKAA